MNQSAIKKIAAIALSFLALLLFGCADSTSFSGADEAKNADASHRDAAETVAAADDASDENSDTAGYSANPELDYGQYADDGITENAEISDIPDYSGEAYVTINDGTPFFTKEDYTTEVFETYSDLDRLGRCGAAFANICTELMPTEERGDIRDVHPSGWTSGNDAAKWNRCHLIAFKLAGENANAENLVTGTEYMNTDGMTEFEDTVYDYAKWSGMHILYRVTPLFLEENLVCSGVLMEGYSVEDGGESVSFCVYCYNVEPGVVIDYETGQSWDGEDAPSDTQVRTFVANTRTMKFHDPDCEGAQSISKYNREEITGTRKDLIHAGYEPCRSCNP